MLDARLIGASAKFGAHTDPACLGAISVGDIGIIADTTSCEEGIFTAPNPFSNMNIDVFLGNSVSQT